MGDGAMSKLLEVKGITKNYHDAPGSRNIISDLDLTVETGEFICILGPSGCGKTTLIRCIAGFESCEGEIKIDMKNDIPKPVTPASEGYGQMWKKFNDALWEESETDV